MQQQQKNTPITPSRYGREYTVGDPDPQLSIAFRTPRTLARRHKKDEDDLLGLPEPPSGSSLEVRDSVCPLCDKSDATEKGVCIDCGATMMDPRPRRWGFDFFTRAMHMAGTRGPLLPAFGEVTPLTASGSESSSRGSSPVDLPTYNNTMDADDGGEVSERETMAPTTDGEDEEGADGEIDVGSDKDAEGESDVEYEEDIFYDAEDSPYFAACIPLPDEDEDECEAEEGFTSAEEQGQEDVEKVDAERAMADEEGELQVEEAPDHPEEPAEGGNPSDSDISAPTINAVQMSSFVHSDAPQHRWIAEETVLEMIIRRKDPNGNSLPAEKTDVLMKIFPESQRKIVDANGRTKCVALARINKSTHQWEEFQCEQSSYRLPNDFRRHFTVKHLGDDRAEKRHEGDGKGKGKEREKGNGKASLTTQRKRRRSIRDDEEEEGDDSNVDLEADFVPASKRTCRR